MTEALAIEVVSWFIDTMADQIVSGGKVVLREFGTLSPKITPARDYTHPQTGVPLHVEERATIGFRPAEILIDRIRNR
jgi:nucleoid DNA-binding protein